MMLRCKGPCRSWHLQLVSQRFFHAHDKKYDFNNPAWLVLYREPEEGKDKLNANSDNVIRFMTQTGGIVQEIFGLNYNDLMELDKPTYNRIKTAVYKICEQRAKEQEERERQEAERLKQEEQKRKAELAAQQRSNGQRR